MKTPHALNIYQRCIAFCLAAMVTLGLLGGIDQLAQPHQATDGWATHTSSNGRA